MALTREAGKNGKLATLLAEAGISSIEVRRGATGRGESWHIDAPRFTTDAYV